MTSIGSTSHQPLPVSANTTAAVQTPATPPEQLTPQTGTPLSGSAPSAPPTDSVRVNVSIAESTFEPTATDAAFPEPIAPPSLDEPLTKVIKGPELEARFGALKTEVGKQLEKAELNHAEAVKNLEDSGSFGNARINDVLRTQHAIDQLEDIQALVDNKDSDAVHRLQSFLKSSATNTDTGSEISTDSAYGPNTDKVTLARIRNPESTYVERDFNTHISNEKFVNQFSEVKDGGSPMEAQGNCGPASMAMLIDRMGGEAPTMHNIRKDAGAKTGTRSGTYGLDSDQVERGLKKTLGEQGIKVETETQLFKRNDTEKLIDAMRTGLANGEKMMLLTSNLETGSKGHYIVINEVRDDGSIVVHDPQSKDGENRVYTPEQLKKGLHSRGAHNRLSRLISVKPAAQEAS